MTIDLGSMLNITISVSMGSIIATIIISLLISYFGRKAILGILNDKRVQTATTNFIRNHIIEPFNSMNNRELKLLITETVEKSLELTLKKLKEKEKK